MQKTPCGYGGLRRVPVIPAEAPEGSVRFRSRYFVRFGRVLVQRCCEVPEVSGAGIR